MKTKIISLVMIGLALVGIAFYAARRAGQPRAGLSTVKVTRGNMVRAINTQGTVKLEEVEVGTQVTGMIASFGSDPAEPGKALDCGSHVSKGVVLAQIDPTIYKAEVDRAEAALAAAQGNLVQLQARLEQAEHEWKRAQFLRARKAIAAADYDLALTSFRVAVASVTVGEAAVQEADATLRVARTNLGYTTIKSPSDGVIMERRVNVGQTVVAAFNAPGLFLIAKDSRQMQVWASVGEADIGAIHLGLPVHFTINACHNQAFDGRVAQVRVNPTKTDAAIAYTVVVAAHNSGELLPDMTANLQFEVERHPDALLIPNGALSWSPESSPALSDWPTTAPVRLSDQAAGDTAFPAAEPSSAGQAATLWKERGTHGHLWVKYGELLRPVDVEIGASNGALTEVMGKDVREGMEVILGDVCRADGP